MKKEMKLSLLFGMAYSCVISFALFGPLLGTICFGNAFYYTLLAMIAFILAFINPYIYKLSPKLLVGLILLAACGLIVLPSRYSFNLVELFVFSFGVATICRSFTLYVFQQVSVKWSEPMMAFSFIIAFSTLYLINFLEPFMNRQLALLILSMITLGMCSLYLYTIKLEVLKSIKLNDEKKAWAKETLLAFISIYLVYIGGGISYAGIYPYLEKYAMIDRYYNVLPLVLFLPLAGWMGKKIGNTLNLLMGLLTLTIAFAFFLLPLTGANYFIVQTFLQIGWAFVNVWGFSYAWRLAHKTKMPHVFGYGIIFILLGVLSGSLIANRIIISGLPTIYFGPVSFVPLITGLVFQFLKTESLNEKHEKVAYKEVVKYQKLPLDIFNKMAPLETLTKREKEVLYYYYHADSAQAISEKLYISQNTVRTHIKNGYTKLEINSRNELKKMIDDYRQNQMKR